MSDQQKPPSVILNRSPSEEEFASRSPLHLALLEAGVRDAINKIQEACVDLDLPWSIVIEVGDEIIGAGRVPEGASLNVQVAALAGQNRLEDVLTGLAGALGVPVGPQGDGDLTTEDPGAAGPG